ncbi:MAG: DUF4834 family protein [Alistipes sp.]
MNIIMALINGIIAFIRRNPLTVLILLLLALLAPSLLKGLMMFVLYFILGLVLLAVLLLIVFRVRIRNFRQQMADQFKQQGAADPRSNAQEQRASEEREGEIRIYKTSDTPTKKVSKEVGDYVEFEETNEKEK